MCRWFVYVSEKEECLLYDVLIAPDHGISKQAVARYLPGLIHHSPTGDDAEEKESAARNALYNIDGLGVAWYTSSQDSFGTADSGQRPALYKTTAPPANDLNFRSICANTSTTCVFAHIRASSGTAITPVNNHPFVFGRHTFMHNGSVSNFLAIRRALADLIDADAYANIQGSTDSEHVAALYITNLTGGRGRPSWEEEYSAQAMGHALHNAVASVISLQQKLLGTARRPNSLNFAATDGRRLVSYRFRNHATEQPPSLYWSTTAGVTLNRKYPGSPNKGQENVYAVKSADEHQMHVIVASEPTTHDEGEWQLMGKNTCAMIDTDGEVKVEEVPYGAGWDAEDPA